MKKFPGLTREDCAAACNEKACVLAVGRSFCFHPCKGGVPTSFKNDPEARSLQVDARAALGLKPLEGAMA